MARGEVPYRDFELEYPPAALPVFLLPAVGIRRVVRRALRRAHVRARARRGRARRASRSHGVGRAAGRALRRRSLLAALAPLLIGPLILSRFDLWPAALVAAALAALVARPQRLGLGLLGAAVATKLFPLVLLPLARRSTSGGRRGRREALVSLGVFAAVVLVIFGPFLLALARRASPTA